MHSKTLSEKAATVIVAAFFIYKLRLNAVYSVLS
nr:MAG TPA: hypothetical protein [Caudoviricetes sp.]